MAEVTGEYPDYSKPNNKSYFRLTCDKTMFPGYWTAPIKWTGTIDGIKVEFEQISVDGFAEYHYNFENLPEDSKPAIPNIVEAINEAMRRMD